jgi:IS5 family transposase
MQQLLSQPEKYQHPKLHLFRETELGRIHSTIPWQTLETCLPEQDISKPGPSQFLSNAGIFGMMFLKHILDVSDEKLIERFNNDWSCQLFCGKLLRDDEKIRNNAFVSNLRSYIAHNADLDCIQQVLLKHLESDMEMTQALFIDATCYESYIRFPTDIKLLWVIIPQDYSTTILSMNTR